MSEGKSTSVRPSGTAWLLPVLVIVGLGALVYVAATSTGPTGFFGMGLATPMSPTGDAQTQLGPGETVQTDKGVQPSSFLARREYFKEVFEVNRKNYRVFESAATFTGKPVSEMPAFFSLKNEDEIFEDLPPVPADFSEIAYLLASGKFFAISGLNEGYWKQPELYPVFQDSGLHFWTQPDPKSWASNGYGTYPAEQWATLTEGDTESFEATVFLYTGFGVQTYQGITLFPTTGDSQYFDLDISPKTFLLGPTFPAFDSDWAKKITIHGTVKPGTPKGEYVIGINIGVPPEDKRREWVLDYRNLYQDGAAGVRPSGNQIVLHVNVE